MNAFGEDHRRLRLENSDQTLREYAKRLGVSPTYLSNVEKGIEPPFSDELLKKSVRLMSLSVHEGQKLALLRVKTTERKKMEKAAFQLARRTKHLSAQEFAAIMRKARRVISKQTCSSIPPS
jgi:hypothetical protein